MKKLINCGIAAALCASALSAQAFAADITEDRSVYAENAEELAASLKDIALDTLEWSVAPDSVMPLYYAKITDFINTGILELSAEMPWDKRRYIADLIDRDGEYAGMGEIDESESGELVFGCYTSRYNPFGVEQHRPASFSYHSEAIRSALAAKGIDTDVKEVKLVFIDGLGTVYYIDNGTEKVLVPAWEANGVIQNYFPGNTYYDAVVVNEDLRATAIRLKEENDRLLAEAGGFGAGGAEGAGNPNTGGTSPAPAGKLGIALAVCAIGIFAAKKKKDQ